MCHYPMWENFGVGRILEWGKIEKFGKYVAIKPFTNFSFLEFVLVIHTAHSPLLHPSKLF